MNNRINFKSFLENNLHSCIFFLYYAIGLFCFMDYGIGWDDEWSRTFTGYVNLDYVFGIDETALKESNERYHGPFVEIVLVLFEKISGLTDTAHIYKLRHFLLFNFFFIAVLLFYKILLHFFDKKLALIGSLFLILSPRFFAESFYNSKDIAMTSFFIYGIYTMLKFIENKNVKWLFIHSLISAFVIDIRILGIIIPMFTTLYLIIESINKKEIIVYVEKVFAYIFLTFIFMVLFWPIMWEGPVEHFILAFKQLSKYPWVGHIFFLNHPILTTELPWYYIPVWIIVTTPVIYTTLFIAGIISIIFSVVKYRMSYILKNLKLLTIISLFFFPLLSVIFLHSTMYDGWRHLYFVYPVFIIISIYGLNLIHKYLEKYNYQKYLNGIIAINSVIVIFWMIKNHPFQNVYFNAVSRLTIDASNKFDRDYWGLSYRQALEYIIENENDKSVINISVLNVPGNLNLMILKKEDREKFILKDYSDPSWEYFITNFRGESYHKELEVVKEIKVDGTPIVGIYKRK